MILYLTACDWGASAHLLERFDQCPTLSGLKVKDAIRKIEADGWRLARTRGSHRQYQHPQKPGLVTIAGLPSADLDVKTERSILRQAGLK